MDYFSKLNSSERRFVVFVGMSFFLVINIFWVWPHFSDWAKIRDRLTRANKTLATFDAMFVKTNALGLEVEKMQHGGGNVPAEDQAVEFLRTIQSQAGQTGVHVVSNGRLLTRTNQFFMEQIQTISAEAEEKEFVDFLYGLGNGDSLVRVRDLSIHPNQPHQLLQANITLIASYQKNVRARPAATNKPQARPSPAPATAPASSPAPGTVPGTVPASRKTRLGAPTNAAGFPVPDRSKLAIPKKP